MLSCSGCPRRFHLECAGLSRRQEWHSQWRCAFCTSEEEGSNGRGGGTLKKRVASVRAAHRALRLRSWRFFERERMKLAPFVDERKLTELCTPSRAEDPAKARPVTIGAHPPFVKGLLRDYQVAGVNWMLGRHAVGVGGILGDEMGLGKTIQTLAFLSALKATAGRCGGPYLVVTPLAVLQNWVNEIKRFTPQLSHVKIHGSVGERDQILGQEAVLRGEYDVYLTTYDTLLAEEAFFTEAFPFHVTRHVPHGAAPAGRPHTACERVTRGAGHRDRRGPPAQERRVEAVRRPRAARHALPAAAHRDAVAEQPRRAVGAARVRARDAPPAARVARGLHGNVLPGT